ncbi:MAG: hypothetical protein ACI9E5_000849 [Candidatus Omnitrophota bacterium]|jgi:hypothetical protein
MADTYYTLEAEFSNHLIATNLQLYYQDNGEYPNTLNDLYPEYLSEVSKDPFNDFKDIKYIVKEDEVVIYSIGPDRVDQGGDIAFDYEIYQEQRGSDESKIGDVIFKLKK